MQSDEELFNHRFYRPAKKSPFKQGFYQPRNPSKYIGNHIPVYRSSWELEVHKILDNNPNILRWASELIPIPYVKPTDKKVHRYFPDYYIEYKHRDGSFRKMILEVKPASQTKASVNTNRRRRLLENIEVAINCAKWQAAVKWCSQRGINFKVATEHEIFKSYGK